MNPKEGFAEGDGTAPADGTDSQEVRGGDLLAVLEKAEDTKIFLIHDEMAESVHGTLQSATAELISCQMQMDDLAYADGPTEGMLFYAAIPSEGCTYHFRCAFHSLTPLPEKTWFFETPEVIFRQQSRNFVRVPASLPIRVRFRNAYGGSKKIHESLLIDISGNGLCFTLEEGTETDVPVDIVIPELPAFGEFRTTATVRRSLEKKVLNHVIYHIGVMFSEELSKSDKRKLERTLAALQREYLKRGTGVR